jgi:Cu-Zn family superoxide dismutase
MGSWRRWAVLSAVAALLLAGGTLVAGADEISEAEATLRNASGANVGVAEFSQRGDLVRVEARVTGLPSGFHGFHIHSVGSCVAPFTSAGGHFNPDGASHPSHGGDMPVLLVNADGSAVMEFETDRFSVADLLGDLDGSAVIVHALPDNYANVTRYGTPDATTLATGDAGARIACGVIEG